MFQFHSQGRKRLMSKLKWEEFPLTCGRVSLLTYSDLPPVGGGLPTLGRGIHFTHSTNSNVIVIQKHLHRKMFYQIFGHPVALPSRYIKLTITLPLAFFSLSNLFQEKSYSLYILQIQKLIYYIHFFKLTFSPFFFFKQSLLSDCTKLPKREGTQEGSLPLSGFVVLSVHEPQVCHPFQTFLFSYITILISSTSFHAYYSSIRMDLHPLLLQLLL